MVADTAIVNVKIVDGSGAAPTPGCVTIVKDRIGTISKDLRGSAQEIVDGRGKVLAPGFIDAHTHDDRALLAHPDMTAKLSQGVTTVVTGNCGISLAPLEEKEPVPPLNLLGDRACWRYPDFDSYAEALDRRPPALNSLMLIGHSTLRVSSMTELDRPASKSELDRMCASLDQCLVSGAAGMSTGLAYPPAWNAPTEEVVELASVLKDHRKLHTTHMRDEEDDIISSIEETLRIGREADVPVLISHHKTCGRENWGRTRETLSLIADARRSQSVCCDVYPYTASSTVLLREFVTRSERVMITWSTPLPEFAKMDLSDIAKELKCDLYEAVDRLQPAGAIYFQIADEDLERVLAYPDALIGSDGLPHDPHPHPRLWGTFPRVLGHYARDCNLFTLQEGVRKMTGATAETFGMRDRGFIREGMFADLVLFDPETIIDRATYEEPDQPSAGVDTVWINGSCAFDKGRCTENYKGRLLTAFNNL
ncbi:MAG: D-aminoacylase [Pseudomonadota bacterium]